jgi:hypothetical protein
MLWFTLLILAIVTITITEHRRRWLPEIRTQWISVKTCQFNAEFSDVLRCVVKNIVIFGPFPKKQSVLMEQYPLVVRGRNWPGREILSSFWTYHYPLVKMRLAGDFP